MYDLEKSATCRICGALSLVRGLCCKHYNQLRRSGELSIRTDSSPLKRRMITLLHNIKGRCENPERPDYNRYGAKGIRNFLTLDDLESLWKRDDGQSLKKPSINRKDYKLHYTMDNCRFIEMHDNLMEMVQRKIVDAKSLCFRCRINKRIYRKRFCADCKKRTVCKVCHERFPKHGRTQICNNCRFAIRDCAWCGAPIKRDVITVDRNRNAHWFCNRQHQGSWLGHGFGGFGGRKAAS